MIVPINLISNGREPHNTSNVSFYQVLYNACYLTSPFNIITVPI